MNFIQLGNESKAWPFVQARSVLQRKNKTNSIKKDYVLFETGYGPSGLPHIGTFAEIVRTTMIRHAFQVLDPDVPTRLFAFSDDMDGLRKVPENIPNQEMVRKHIGLPLTSIPDPFGTHESFGHHNNDRLKKFLDSFGFDYEFKSSSECYKSGEFDSALISVLENYDRIINLILPTLGSDRRSTYSPFLPVCPETGKVLQVPVVHMDVDAETIVYENDRGKKVETPVTQGHTKLQWKCDWAMRWFAFDVDYEMAGKDLIDSFKLSSKICRILGGRPPENLIYELFLDDKGQKISKSKGNGISVEEWLTYAPHESLAYFMYQKPTTAKRLYFDTIPKSVDEYLNSINFFDEQEPPDKLNNPVYHIHKGNPPSEKNHVSFSAILNLVSVCHSDDPENIWYYLNRYVKDLSKETNPMLDKLIGFAIAYYRDFVLPKKKYREPNRNERIAFLELKNILNERGMNSSPEEIQTLIYEVGKNHISTFPNLKDWFRSLYEVLLGQGQGPRMGSFIALYGVKETIALIDGVLDHERKEEK